MAPSMHHIDFNTRWCELRAPHIKERQQPGCSAARICAPQVSALTREAAAPLNKRVAGFSSRFLTVIRRVLKDGEIRREKEGHFP